MSEQRYIHPYSVSLWLQDLHLTRWSTTLIVTASLIRNSDMHTLHDPQWGAPAVHCPVLFRPHLWSSLQGTFPVKRQPDAGANGAHGISEHTIPSVQNPVQNRICAVAAHKGSIAAHTSPTAAARAGRWAEGPSGH
jgi:hypothetical protein